MSSAAEFSKELASCNTLHFNSWWLNTSRNRQYIQIHRCFYWEDNLSLKQNISRSDSELIILTTLLLCLTRVKGAKYGTNAGVHCSPLPDTYSMCLLPWAGMKKLRRLFESYPWATKAPKLTQLYSALIKTLTKHSAASSMNPSWKRCSSLKLSARACLMLSDGRAFSLLCWNCEKIA